MSSIGIICHEIRGHLNPMLTVARELRSRAHQVTFLCLPDGGPLVYGDGFGFRPFGLTEFPVGSLAEHTAMAGRLTGMKALNHFSKRNARMTEVLLRDLPDSVRESEFDLLLVDQDVLGGTAVADALGVPFVTICLQLAMNWGRDVPPWMMPWRYSTSTLAKLRSLAVYGYMSCNRDPGWKLVDEFRRKHGLPVAARMDEYYSQLAQISQQPAELEYPRRLPDCFHFAGPFFRPGEIVPRPFPWDRLDGRPLIYASLGTLQNGLPHLFETIARACDGLDAQLVISLNRGTDPQPQDLPGNPIVVEHAPQQELLARAALAITHGGMNTVLEALSYGVPLVAVPITNDQPGVAARVAWSGAGEMVTLKRFGVKPMRAAITRVLTEETYAVHAMRLREAIAAGDGPATAADIIERVLATTRPVTSESRLAGVQPLSASPLAD